MSGAGACEQPPFTSCDPVPKGTILHRVRRRRTFLLLPALAEPRAGTPTLGPRTRSPAPGPLHRRASASRTRFPREPSGIVTARRTGIVHRDQNHIHRGGPCAPAIKPEKVTGTGWTLHEMLFSKSIFLLSLAKITFQKPGAAPSPSALQLLLSSAEHRFLTTLLIFPALDMNQLDISAEMLRKETAKAEP